jgi:drug/metabolite transporter (DMT)-like permease
MTTKDWLRFWILGLIWGTSFLWIKIAVTEVSPFVLVGFRTLFGALGLLVIMWSQKTFPKSWKEIRPWLGVFAVVGLINVALPFVLISWSEQYISSGIASILNSTVPLFTMLLAPLVLRDDRMTLPKTTGLLIGFVGVLILFSPELAQAPGVNQGLVGQGVMLLATLSYAAGSIYVRLKARGLAPQLQAFLQLSTANVMVWLFTGVAERPILLPHLALTWLALLWLGLLGSCVAYILFFSLMNSIGPTRTTMVTYIPPLVGVLLGAIFLGERLNWQAIVGGALILSGITVVNMKKLPFKKPSRLKEEEPACCEGEA